MDAIYGVQRHIYDLTRRYYLLGRNRLIHELAVPPGGHVLEIGCGTGRNMALAARHYSNAHFYGLDISAEMLKSAREKLGKGIFSGRCELALGDASSFDAQALFSRSHFDRIFFSYTLSMIPDWRRALANGCSLLAAGGSLHIVDFGQQEDLPHWFRHMLKAWLAGFHVAPRAELFSVCEALASEHGLKIETRKLYRDYAQSVMLTRG